MYEMPTEAKKIATTSYQGNSEVHSTAIRRIALAAISG
jgi:hypothetical protein